MDPHTQQTILEAVGKHGRENLIVLLGTPSPESAAIAAETVTSGDPTYAGPLAETRLGLIVYHILEEPVRAALDPAIYDQQVAPHQEISVPFVEFARGDLRFNPFERKVTQVMVWVQGHDAPMFSFR